jgi:hypothetical protein
MECTREDAEAVVSMLKAILSRLDLDSEDVAEMVKRSERHEVHLMYLRFFNILMSRKKGKGEEAKVSSGVSVYVRETSLVEISKCKDRRRACVRHFFKGNQIRVTFSRIGIAYLL